jgi:hypothetical protein
MKVLGGLVYKTGLMLVHQFQMQVQINQWEPIFPMHTAPEVTGSFCEIRSNHFHSGVDFRTEQREGLEVMAIDSGYISRIYIQPGGYGNMLMVRHSNGLSSLYGHLQDFTPEIRQYADSLRVVQRKNTLDTMFTHTRFPVKKGQVIAKSGNTGSSTGPHLHFEIRESATQVALDPFRFGIGPSDKEVPLFEKLGIYSIQGTPDLYRALELDVLPGAMMHSQGNRITSYPETLLVVPGWYGLAAMVFDRQKASGFKNGPNRLEMWVEDKNVFSMDFTRLDFNETRYINAHVDYPASLQGAKWRRFFRLPNDRLSNYVGMVNNGLIKVESDKSIRISLIAKDYAGNESKLNLVLYGKGSSGTVFTGDWNVLPGKSDSILGCGAALVYGKASFYQPEWLEVKCADYRGPGGNPVYSVGSSRIPVHDEVSVYLPVPQIFPEHISKWVGAVKYKGRFVPCKSVPSGNFIKLNGNDLGDFTLILDTIAPQVMGTFIPKEGWVAGKAYSLQLKDDFSGITQWEVWFGDEFVPADLSNSGLLRFRVPGKYVRSGVNRLIVRDKAGNVSEKLLGY